MSMSTLRIVIILDIFEMSKPANEINLNKL
jgi:hypothetical protein